MSAATSTRSGAPALGATGLVVILGVAVVASVAFSAASVVAARQLVGRRRTNELRFEVDDNDTVRLPATPQTVRPGEYGLRYDDGRGHARIGAVVDGGEGSEFVRRRLTSVTGTVIPRHGTGAWVRDVYPTPAAAGLVFESVDIVSDAGISPAWVVPPRNQTSSSVWVIHLHGIRTTRSVVLPGVSALRDLGITSLAASWRGDSEGPATANGTSSLGQEEWRDVEEAIAFAVSSGAESVILVGWSMGGAIVRLLMEKSRFRGRVAGVVLISPVTSWRAVVKHGVSAARLPSAVAWGVEAVLANPVLSKLAGLPAPVSIAALDRDPPVGARPIPTLVLHNPGDDVVPFASVAAYAARNSAHSTLVVFDESPHGMEWNREPQKFEDTLRVWVSSVLRDVGWRA